MRIFLALTNPAYSSIIMLKYQGVVVEGLRRLPGEQDVLGSNPARERNFATSHLYPMHVSQHQMEY